MSLEVGREELDTNQSRIAFKGRILARNEVTVIFLRYHAVGPFKGKQAAIDELAGRYATKRRCTRYRPVDRGFREQPSTEAVDAEVRVALIRGDPLGVIHQANALTEPHPTPAHRAAFCLIRVPTVGHGDQEAFGTPRSLLTQSPSVVDPGGQFFDPCHHPLLLRQRWQGNL